LIPAWQPDGSVSDDPDTQFRDTFKFLSAAGLHFGDIVDMTTYHVGLGRHLNAFIKIKDEFVQSPYPAWTAIGVTELITESTLLEIRVIAKRACFKRRSASVFPEQWTRGSDAVSENTLADTAACL
jgi:hypothetical protein